jgi:hypothetical protein
MGGIEELYDDPLPPRSTPMPDTNLTPDEIEDGLALATRRIDDRFPEAAAATLEDRLIADVALSEHARAEAALADLAQAVREREDDNGKHQAACIALAAMTLHIKEALQAQRDGKWALTDGILQRALASGAASASATSPLSGVKLCPGPGNREADPAAPGSLDEHLLACAGIETSVPAQRGTGFFGPIRIERRNDRWYVYNSNDHCVADGEPKTVKDVLLTMGYAESDMQVHEG